ncbi:MAG: CHAT domain-containing protein [Bacteroidales bacterium]|nr:CHAT domain-containing protein [Bacteroidales bacterium]
MKLKKIIITAVNLLVFSFSVFSQTDDDASNFFNEANNALQQGNLDLAIENFSKSSQIFKQNNNNNYLIAKHGLANTYLYKGDIQNANEILQEITPEIENLNPQNENLLAEVYNLQAQIFSNTGEINKSIDFFTKAYNIYFNKFGDKNPNTLNIIRNLGMAYSYYGDDNKSLEFLQKAKDNYIEIEGNNSQNVAICYLSIGQIENSIGNIDQAILNFSKSLEILNSFENKDYSLMSENLEGLGACYINKREFEQADGYITKSIEIKSQIFGENDIKLYKNYYYQAMIFDNKCDYDNALKYYSKSEKLIINFYGKNNPDLGNIYNAMAMIYNNSKDYSKSLEYYKKASNSFIETYGENASELALVFNNIGLLKFNNHDLDSALFYFEKSINILSAKSGDKNVKLIEPYLNIGSLNMERKDYKNAIKFYKKSIECNVTNFDNNDDILANPSFGDFINGIKLIDALKNKAKATAQLYDSTKQRILLSNIVECVKISSQFIDEVRKTTKTENDKITLGELSKEIYETGLYATSIIFDFDNNYLENLEDAFYFIEKSKSATLLEAINNTGATQFADIPNDLILEEQNLAEKISDLKKLIAEEENLNNINIYKSQLFEISDKYNKLINQFENQYPKYYKAKYSNKYLAINDIQENLNDNNAIISYFTGKHNVFYILITNNNFVMSRIDINQNKLVEQTGDLIEYLTTYDDLSIKNYAKLAFQIFSEIFPKNMPKNINQITIIPDGCLYIIPFEALLTEEYTKDSKKFNDYPYLIKKYNINYNYSSQLIYEKSKISDNNTNINWLGIAPGFDGEQTTYFKDIEINAIPETITEIENISNKINSEGMVSEKIIRKDANETNIKKLKLNEYNIIHIATHGIVDTEKPELSGILLENDKNSNDDGMLYNGEIYNLKLNANLVVLSACETGLGKIAQGEGVIGLGRSLLYAGAKNIICSLWQVSDVSTSKLMIDFYNNMFNFDKSKSFKFSNDLHNAKLEMIKTNKFAHPYFWSPFIIIGK